LSVRPSTNQHPHYGIGASKLALPITMPSQIMNLILLSIVPVLVYSTSWRPPPTDCYHSTTIENKTISTRTERKPFQILLTPPPKATVLPKITFIAGASFVLSRQRWLMYPVSMSQFPINIYQYPNLAPLHLDPSSECTNSQFEIRSVFDHGASAGINSTSQAEYFWMLSQLHT
jgi:hypothetical protein